jgi:parallel beta-helix repeat protein
MKSSAKSKILILTALTTLFAFSPIITTNLSFITSSCIKSSEYSNDINLGNKNLKISQVSEKIHIDGNSCWVDFKNAGNCTGNGLYSDPYVIEDLVIDGEGLGSCIWIEKSEVYFKIENCSLYNSGSGLYNAGIKLSYVINGQLIDNNCSNNNGVGIGLYQSQNISIEENTVNNNDEFGIFLEVSHNNIFSKNTLNENSNGIYLGLSNNNFILNNSAYNNNWRGIYLSSSSNNNTIKNNNVSYNDDNGMLISDSQDIKIIGNIANHNGWNGILVWESNINTISGNNASYNTFAGIYLYKSNNNFIAVNTITNNYVGIYLYYSKYNDVLNNIFNGNGNDIQEVQEVPNNGNQFPLEIVLIRVVALIVIIMSIAGILILRKRRSINRTEIKDPKKSQSTSQSIEILKREFGYGVRALEVIPEHEVIKNMFEEQPEELEALQEEVVEITPEEQQEVLKPPELQIIKCPFCGIEIDEETAFCQQCGMKIKKK